MAGTANASYVKYSKRLATAVAVFWGFYRIASLIVLVFRPTIGDALFKMSSGVDDVMMVSLGVYTGNSVAEKGIIGYFESRKTVKSKENDQDESNG